MSTLDRTPSLKGVWPETTTSTWAKATSNIGASPSPIWKSGMASWICTLWSFLEMDPITTPFTALCGYLQQCRTILAYAFRDRENGIFLPFCRHVTQGIPLILLLRGPLGDFPYMLHNLRQQSAANCKPNDGEHSSQGYGRAIEQFYSRASSPCEGEGWWCRFWLRLRDRKRRTASRQTVSWISEIDRGVPWTYAQRVNWETE